MSSNISLPIESISLPDNPRSASKRLKQYTGDCKFDHWLWELIVNELGAKLAVIEKEYVDSYFLDEYKAYYARSFNRYSSICSRIHFFSMEQFEEAICRPSEFYLGSIVLLHCFR